MLRTTFNSSEGITLTNLRVALINYILSKQLNDNLLIRIEDLNKNGAEDKNNEILEVLELFSLEYSQVVYQSDNFKYHQKLAMQLMTNKKAFACFCSEEKLKELEEYDDFCANLSDETVLNCTAPFTVRIKKPQTNINFDDLLFDKIEYSASAIDSFFILNHDKTPTLNYATAVDDMLQDISTIVRTNDQLLQSAKEIHLRNMLGYSKEIKYIHIPSVIENRDNYTVKRLIDEGFLPSSIANYLILLSLKTPKKIFSMEEAIEWFDINNISKDDVEFDIEVLKEINKEHLAELDNMRFSKILGFADEDIGKLAKLYLNEAFTINEIREKIEQIFSPKSTCEGFENEFVELKLAIQEAPYFDKLDELSNFLSQKTDLKEEKLFTPLRYLLTGNTKGPDLKEIYNFIKNYIREIVK